MVCLSRPYPLKFFKGCFPQILLGPFLNTLSHMYQTFTYYNYFKHATFFFDSHIIFLLK